MKSKKDHSANPLKARTGVEGCDEIIHDGLPVQMQELRGGELAVLRRKAGAL